MVGGANGMSFQSPCLFVEKKKHIYFSNALFRYIKFALCSTLLLHIFIEFVHCGKIKFQE